jgi:3-oxoadipate enol-lactonase
MASQVAPAMQRWLAERNRANPALVARMTRLIETTPLEGYAGWCQAIETLDITARLKAITLPTQVIVGAEDPATPPAAAQAIHREIAGSTLIQMPATAHMLCSEDPATFHGHVLGFLAKHAK